MRWIPPLCQILIHFCLTYNFWQGAPVSRIDVDACFFFVEDRRVSRICSSALGCSDYTLKVAYLFNIGISWGHWMGCLQLGLPCWWANSHGNVVYFWLWTSFRDWTELLNYFLIEITFFFILEGRDFFFWHFGCTYCINSWSKISVLKSVTLSAEKPHLKHSLLNISNVFVPADILRST